MVSIVSGAETHALKLISKHVQIANAQSVQFIAIIKLIFRLIICPVPFFVFVYVLLLYFLLL